MRNIQVPYQGSDLNFGIARRLARDAAKAERMMEPTIVSWHRRGTHDMSSYYDGADPDSWWEKYGEGNGGRLEVSVGDDYDFVLLDSRGYDTVDEIPLRNLEGSDGQEYICYAPMLGNDREPNAEACMPLDEWLADQY